MTARHLTLPRQAAIIFTFRWPAHGQVGRLLFGNLKGLEDAIGMTVVDPVRDDLGWAFRDTSGKIPPGAPFESTDPINGFQFLSEAYTATDPDYKRARDCAGPLGHENKADREQLRGRHLPHVQRRV